MDGARSGERSPLILALDTTTRAGSVAVVRDGSVIAEVTGDPALTHGERLPGDLWRALDAAGVRLDEIGLLAVAAGPGSFTGLRVGIAAMQGLAFARGLKIVPVSTLDALFEHARDAAHDETLVAAWMDAQRGEVFAALYTRAGTVIRQPSSSSPAATLDACRDVIGNRPVLFSGEGALRYQGTIRSALGRRAQILEPAPSLAAPIGRIAAREPGRAVVPHAVVPIYVRRSDAELARERARGSAQR